MNNYVIIKEEGIIALEKKVNTYVEKGFQPIGGPCTVKINKQGFLIQAMFKKPSPFDTLTK